MSDDHVPPPRKSATLPRPLAALSIAVGLGLPLAVTVDTGGMPGAPIQDQLTAMFMLILFHIGYILAPFLIGFSQWKTFFAGIALAPALAGWVSMFLPSLGQDSGVLLPLLAAVSVVALIGDYVWVVRHLAMDFFSNRRSGGRGE